MRITIVILTITKIEQFVKKIEANDQKTQRGSAQLPGPESPGIQLPRQPLDVAADRGGLRDQPAERRRPPKRTRFKPRAVGVFGGLFFHESPPSRPSQMENWETFRPNLGMSVN